MKLIIWSIRYRKTGETEYNNGICVENANDFDDSIKLISTRYFSISENGQLKEIKFSFDMEFKHMIQFKIGNESINKELEK